MFRNINIVAQVSIYFNIISNGESVEFELHNDDELVGWERRVDKF